MRKRYRVTEAAGPWVAGRKVSPGDILELTDEQAEYEILRDQIEAAGASEQATERVDSAPRNNMIDSAPRKRGR